MNKKLKGNLMLLITALIWGTAFVAQSKGMDYIGPFTYSAVRTFLGGIVLIPVIVFLRKFNGTASSESKAPMSVTIRGGIICGIILCIASSLQQVGISMTTAGKAGFISAIYIIAVPLIEFFLYKKKSVFVWICALIAFAGLYLLCVNENLRINRGDMIVLYSAFGFTVHIMVIDRFNSKGADGLIMSCIQFFTASIFMAIAMFTFETPALADIFDARYTILYAGIMSSGVAFTLQILGQRYTDPTSASLLMSLESVFAALSGWLILNEIMSLKEFSGCILVFAAVILSQLQDMRKNKKKTNKGEFYEKTSE
ncbi:MAG: DMT family transporter [Oscillospiraceae bacterium]|nr:DMT family transporter [Oscillospiraceae bacterium]